MKVEVVLSGARKRGAVMRSVAIKFLGSKRQAAMKTFWSGSFAAVLVLSSAAVAQEPADFGASSTPVAMLQTPRPAGSSFTELPLSPPVVTPELWLYSQDWRRHDDPAQAVRRKAEARTEQRMQRLAAMKWYGFSNSRPQANVTPF